MAPKPSHVKAVAGLLEQEHDSPEQLAKDILNLADELRAKDATYTVVTEYRAAEGSTYYGVGPYATQAQAIKAIEKGALIPWGEGRQVVVRVRHPVALQRARDEADEPPPSKGDFAVIRKEVEASGRKMRG